MHLSSTEKFNRRPSPDAGDADRNKAVAGTFRFACEIAWLTPQLRRVLELLGDGLSNKLIARKLGIVESTVKVYVSKLIQGFGCDNRTQVALLALRIRYRLPLDESLSED
ncbi:MAG: LuxR C-terminal-related transcriptional regulator [Alphaproteobacteria bacterium]|nr:LuxR C-terminal-related transcriptional regulator [Alphaproteobacteria bacterium]